MEKNVVDFKSDIPLHVQLKDILRQEILQGLYQEKIPSERELMARFGISRSTVRQAVLELVQEGVLEKIHGKGTFISLRPVEEWLGSLQTFNEVIQEQGMCPGIRLLHHGIARPPKDVSAALGLTGQDCYLVERLRFANEQPVALEKQYYPLEIGKRLAQYDLNNAAIYDLLENELGIKLWEAEQVITVAMATAEEAAMLQVEPGACLFLTERFIIDATGRGIEYEHTVYRSDLYAFRIKMTRKRV